MFNQKHTRSLHEACQWHTSPIFGTTCTEAISALKKDTLKVDLNLCIFKKCISHPIKSPCRINLDSLNSMIFYKFTKCKKGGTMCLVAYTITPYSPAAEFHRKYSLKYFSVFICS